jgi:ribosomal protein S18 acetylase RimI-like enzyme
VRWQLARARVAPPPPPGSFYIAELNVDAEYRNQGVGGALLSRAEQAAQSRGLHTLSLNTAVTNPARRLYQRYGYVVTETRCDPGYERITTIPGRVLMVKALVS